MTVPIWDWQFIVVTLIAASAVAVLARQFLPARGRKPGPGGGAATATLSKPGCAHCASNSDTAPAMPARTVMTQVVSMHDLRDTARQAKH